MSFVSKQQPNLKNGVYCGVTGRKPEFVTTCDIIDFGKYLEDKILEVNVELELVKRTKVDTIGHFILFLLIGLSVIFFGTRLLESFGMKILTNDGGLSTLALVPMVFIVLIGIGLIVFAIAPLNLYRRNNKIALQKKEKLDACLGLYQLTYTIELQINKHWAGHKEVEHKLAIYTKKHKGHN